MTVKATNTLKVSDVVKAYSAVLTVVRCCSTSQTRCQSGVVRGDQSWLAPAKFIRGHTWLSAIAGNIIAVSVIKQRKTRNVLVTRRELVDAALTQWRAAPAQ